MPSALFQYFPVYKPAVTARLIKSIPLNECQVVLDLEDSIQDVQNPERTSALKAKAREDLKEIIRLIPELKIVIRINSIRTKEFTEDVRLLKSIGGFKRVIIPKLESLEELDNTCSELGSDIPIDILIETQKGIDNLDAILTSKNARRIEYVFFGNYDYHLDRKLYPIREQNSNEYWEIVKPIIKKVEQYGLNFGNSPYAVIRDLNTLPFIVSQLKKYCKGEFAVVSLHKSQSVSYLNILKGGLDTSLIIETPDEKIFTPFDFQKGKIKGRSFAFDYSEGRIITPHEYLLSKSLQDAW